ncbi:hypothetical protein DL770_004557 [Monosporascus sp. CRB-9-2]|nr:hypothetical protein DL770_004557 [Monosporascus sp. CRB-9-2]
MPIHGAFAELSFPYRQSREGFFGAKTATLNFCEEASTRVLGLARYYVTKDPQFHQDAYAILTAIVVFSNMFIMEYSVRPALQSRDRKRAPNSHVQASNVILKEMWLMVATGQQIDTVGDLTTGS